MLDLIGRQFFKHRINGDQIFNRQAGFGAEVPDLLQRLGIEQHQFFPVEQLVNFDIGALGNLRDSYNLVKADLGEAGDLLDDGIADNGHHALLGLAAQLACRHKGDAVADDDKDIVADDAGWLVTPLGIGNQVRPVLRRGTDMDRAILCHGLTVFQRQRRGRHHPGHEGEQQGGGNEFCKKAGALALRGRGVALRCGVAHQFSGDLSGRLSGHLSVILSLVWQMGQSGPGQVRRATLVRIASTTLKIRKF